MSSVTVEDALADVLDGLGLWVLDAACGNAPGFCVDLSDATVVATCLSCPVSAECSTHGRAELLRALRMSDIGDGRVYAGHRMHELVRHARSGRARKKEALQLLEKVLEAPAMATTLGYLCCLCGRSVAQYDHADCGSSSWWAEQ